MRGDRADRRDVVRAADAGAADAGDDAGRQKARGAIGFDSRLQASGPMERQRPPVGMRTRFSSPMPDTQMARSIEVWTWSEE